MNRVTFSLIFVLAAVVCCASLGRAAIHITATNWDFNATHSDFESALGIDSGIVESTLGGNGLPVYAGGPANTLTTHGETAFNQWYRDVPGVGLKTAKTLTLTETSPGLGIFQLNDSSFFPIDGKLLGNQRRLHNYHFTTEIHTEFTCSGGETLDFAGDDDMWMFINRELVIDLGGVHEALSDSVSLDTMGLRSARHASWTLSVPSAAR